jgi:hypothetical protein
MSLRSVSTVVRIELPNKAAALPYQNCAAMKARQCQKMTELRAALVGHGFDTAAKQALVLGLSRSSAWKILRGDYKQSGLSASTIKRILASPELPRDARLIIEQYIREKLQGAYGHRPNRLKNFGVKLSNQNELKQTPR